ncbi:Na+-driven multidrug efflux pump [Zunongwangia mangrovi]|uniref:Na+-driven multidrug efflux pump n=1 Tax=Zunongwangia mangrovi TaxID=1334022 RepID=A0A1I1DA50_9FLAO|nr:hypothetical protein [Zunongwangia mangrovi]SFB69958.1 Na+-driven multidrug efflux pump [Zunongwangia mangrovi]
MSTANRVIKNTGFLYAKMGITMFISLYTTRLVLNALGTSDYGIYSVVGGAVAMLGFLNAAMASATQRFMSFYEGKGDRILQKKIFNVSIVLHFGIGIFLALILLLAGYFFFNGILNIPDNRIYAAKFVYGSLIVSTVFTVMSVPYQALLNAHENMFYFSIVGVLESILKLLVALFVVYTAMDKLKMYGVLMALIPLVILTIMRVYCHKHYSECVVSPKRFWDKSLLKEMTGFAGWNFLGSTISIVAQYGQGIVLNMFFGTRINAAQGVANQVNGQVSVFAATMLKALNPVIVKNEGAGKRRSMLRTAMVGSKFSFFLLALFAIPICIEMPYILKLWIKNVPEYTVIFCRLLLIISLIDQLFITLPSAISATGKIRNYQLSVSVLLTLPIVLGCILFTMGYPPYTLYVLFITQRLIRGFGVVLHFAKKIVGLSKSLFLKQVVVRCLLSTMVSLSIGILIIELLEEGLFRLIITLVVTFIVGILSSYYIGLASDERGQVMLLYGQAKVKIGEMLKRS